MILGIGIDLVDIRRIENMIENFGDRFLNKIFTPAERSMAQGYSISQKKISYFAKRFSGKEAFVKALGTGFRHGISWQDISISSDSEGCPHLTLTGKALELVMTKLPHDYREHLHISMTDDYPYAQSIVLIEGIKNSTR
jgi:holo-[acyl-carrier protein] synthase